MDSIRKLEHAIIRGDTKIVAAITMQCLEEGVARDIIIENGILKGLSVVGQKWKDYEYFIPNVLVSAMATKLSLGALQSALKESRKSAIGKAMAGTVQGDVHDIGKNILLMFMEFSGFEVIDLGIDVSPEHFVKMVKSHKPDLLLLSCLYTVTMHGMEDTIISLRKAGLQGSVKTIVGGAPITQEFAQQIGADGFGANAMDGVKKAKELMRRSKPRKHSTTLTGKRHA